MEFSKIEVEIRTNTGKGAARRTRAAGKVPGVLYGHKEAPLGLALDPRMLLKSLDKEKRRNTVFTLGIATDGKTQDVMAMIRDAQIDPLTNNIVHIDFIRVSLDEEIRVTVPLVLEGNPIGIINGGSLHHNLHNLALAARPDAIPARIVVDVSGLDVGNVLHVKDLKLQPGLRPLVNPEDPIASVVIHREEVIAPAETAAAAATPAAGTAPAAGEAAKTEAKADAKPAKADAKPAKADAGKK